MTLTQRNLLGRLEKVHIVGEASQKCARGRFNNENILVTGANLLVGSDCLVRFDDNIDSGKSVPTSHLISANTSQVPENFLGYSPAEYVLYGVWPTGTRNNNAPHEYTEFTELHNPGYVPFFVDVGALGPRDNYLVSRRRTTELDDTIGRVIRRSLPDYNRGCRVIMIKTERDREAVVRALEDNNLRPIRLD